MATSKVWDVKYIAGNPAMYSKDTTAAGGPFGRTEALEGANTIAGNGGGWRVWVEHYKTGKRIFESEAEQQFKRNAEAKRIIDFAERNVPGFR